MRNSLLALTLVCASAAQADVAYITSQTANAVSVLDLTTGDTLRRIDVPGAPAGVQIAPDLDRLFTVSPDDETLRAFTLAGEAAGQLVLDGAPIGIARAGGQVFVSDWYNARIWMIDARDLTVTNTLHTGAAPAGLAVSPDGRWLVSADRDADSLSVFALPGGTLHRTIPVGTRPFAVTFDAQGRVFAANVGSHSVSVINPDTGAQIAELPTGRRPYGVAFAANRIFVSNQYGDTISVFDAAFQPIATLDTGEYPEGIAAFDQGRKIIVANWMSDTVMTFDAATFEQLAELPTAEGPRAFGQFIHED